MGRYEIKPADGNRQTRKRIGRGPGSGKGKTAGKGTKGQKSRSGYTYRAWFEGGQMPLQRRVPKRGFTNIFKVPYQVVNLADLERIKGEEVNKEVLKKARLIRSVDKPVKLLGSGTVQKKYKVTVDAFSVSAREAVLTAGGTCIALEVPKKKAKPVRRTRVEEPASETAEEAAEEAAEDKVTEETEEVKEAVEEEGEVETEPEAVVEEETVAGEETPVEVAEASEGAEPEETEPEDKA
jgi:large subunit ribosomal protein L15